MMTDDERATMLRSALDAMYNKTDVDMVDKLYDERCSFHDPTFPIDGVAGMKNFLRELRRAQPDSHMQVHEIICSGDMCAYRFTAGGTAEAEFFGLPPTGKSYVMTGMTMCKWEGDRIVEEWTNYDTLGALQQVGLIPEKLTHEATA